MYDFVVRNMPADELAQAICRHKNDQIWIWYISRVSCQKGPFGRIPSRYMRLSLLYLACIYRCHSAIMCQGLCRHSHNYVPIHPSIHPYQSLFVSNFQSHWWFISSYSKWPDKSFKIYLYMTGKQILKNCTILGLLGLCEATDFADLRPFLGQCDLALPFLPVKLSSYISPPRQSILL